MGRTLTTEEIFDSMKDLPIRNLRMDDSWRIKEISLSAARKVFGEDLVLETLLAEDLDHNQDELNMPPSHYSPSSLPELISQDPSNVHEEVQD